MISVWWVVGLLVLSLCTGVATALVMVLFGVTGVMVALKKRIETVEIGLENVDRRLTTEVKTRAAHKGVEARTEAKSVEDQARVRLTAESAPTVPRRPSVLDIGRR